MPVVINDFEVVVAEEPAESQARAARERPEEGPRAAPPVGPMEVALILERRAERELRLFAH